MCQLQRILPVWLALLYAAITAFPELLPAVTITLPLLRLPNVMSPFAVSHTIPTDAGLMLVLIPVPAVAPPFPLTVTGIAMLLPGDTIWQLAAVCTSTAALISTLILYDLPPFSSLMLVTVAVFSLPSTVKLNVIVPNPVVGTINTSAVALFPELIPLIPGFTLTLP
jgi:hypothetical protein